MEITLLLFYFVFQSTFNMNEQDKLLGELKNIREIMERSSRFLSLSGLSGILVGIYALIGAFFASLIIDTQIPASGQPENVNDKIILLSILGLSVLTLSLLTIFLLTIKKARKQQKQIWGPGSKLLLFNLLIPLVTGGVMILTLTVRGYYDIIIPCFLIFYGLALVNAAKYTRPEILGLGIIEIVIGLIAVIFSDFGLYLWATGFGIVHIVYGFIFLQKETKNQVK